jgi:hypothetical protein
MTRDAYALHKGDQIRIGTHDVYRGTPAQYHVERPDVAVLVTACYLCGTLAIIYWDAICSGVCGVCVYDADQPIELEVAA